MSSLVPATRPLKKVVTVILDETGSMQSIKDDTIGGYNEFLSQMKQEEGDVRFSLLKFDSTHQTMVHSGTPIQSVPGLTPETYRPGASTPLLDACMMGIRDTELHAQDADRVVVAVLTDGQENASRETNKEALRLLIKEKEAQGWFFTYLGIGIEAWAGADFIGIHPDMAIQSTRDNVKGTFKSAGEASARYMSSGSATSGAYTPEERKKAKGMLGS